MKSFGAGLVLGVVAAFLVAIVVWLAAVYTGAYNVAASEPHADPVRWTLDTTMHRSVSSRAEAVDLPEPVPDDLLAAGAGHYSESCVHCHGAPGRDPAPWSRGMRPEPPHLVEAATDWTPGEIRWIVANGIKMTGMPAFGDHHGPEELVALTAFVGALPGLTAGDYTALTGTTPTEATPSEATAEATTGVTAGRPSGEADAAPADAPAD